MPKFSNWTQGLGTEVIHITAGSGKGKGGRKIKIPIFPLSHRHGTPVKVCAAGGMARASPGLASGEQGLTSHLPSLPLAQWSEPGFARLSTPLAAHAAGGRVRASAGNVSGEWGGGGRQRHGRGLNSPFFHQHMDPLPGSAWPVALLAP